MIPLVKQTTITPAIKTPKTIKGRARLIGTPKTKAAKDPVQAPVKGKGIATRITKAKSRQRSNFFECFWRVLSKSQIKKRLKK